MGPPNKGMKQTKPAQAMELRSLCLSGWLHTAQYVVVVDGPVVLLCPGDPRGRRSSRPPLMPPAGFGSCLGLFCGSARTFRPVVLGAAGRGTLRADAAGSAIHNRLGSVESAG